MHFIDLAKHKNWIAFAPEQIETLFCHFTSKFLRAEPITDYNLIRMSVYNEGSRFF